MVDVYMVGDDEFQVDCDKGEFVFRPSRFGAGRIELVEWTPRNARDYAHDVLLSAIIHMI